MTLKWKRVCIFLCFLAVGFLLFGYLGYFQKSHWLGQIFPKRHVASVYHVKIYDNSFGVIIGSQGDASSSSSQRAILIPTFVYHSIRPFKTGESAYQDEYDITPLLFEHELQFIKENGFHTVTSRDIAEYLYHNKTLPSKPVLLTFDDGWKNQYLYAFPLLKEYGMRATFYIYSNPLDFELPQWMSWDDVMELDRAGMEIGGHTSTHPILTTLNNSEQLEVEIYESKRIIEARLGHSITSFAYPFGVFNDQAKSVVMRAGFLTARTVTPGVWEDPQHRYEMHGILASDKLSDFKNILNQL